MPNKYMPSPHSTGKLDGAPDKGKRKPKVNARQYNASEPCKQNRATMRDLIVASNHALLPCLAASK
jgi:hypothetical protein